MWLVSIKFLKITINLGKTKKKDITFSYHSYDTLSVSSAYLVLTDLLPKKQLFQAEFWAQVQVCCWLFHSNPKLLDSKWYLLQTPWNLTVTLLAHHLMTFAQPVNWSFMSLELSWNKLENRVFFTISSNLANILVQGIHLSSIITSRRRYKFYLFVHQLTISSAVIDTHQPGPVTTRPCENPKDYKIIWGVNCAFLCS